MALCRACGESMPFSPIAAQQELDAVDLAKPPKGVRVSRSLISSIEITYRKLSPVVFLLVPFTALWSGLSLSMIYGPQITNGKFDPAASLAGIPFLVGTVILLALLAFLLFGRRRIILGRDRCEVFMGVGPLGWRRSIPLTPESVVRLETSAVRINNVPQRDVVVTTGDSKMKFGATLPDDVRVFLAAVLRKAVQAS